MDFPAKAILMSVCLQQLFPESYCLPPLEIQCGVERAMVPKLVCIGTNLPTKVCLEGPKRVSLPFQVHGPFCQMFSVRVPPMVPGTNQAPIFSHMFVFANSPI